MEHSLIDNIVFYYDMDDSPDFADASIFSADYDGFPMTENQLEEINNDSQFIHDKLIGFLF